MKRPFSEFWRTNLKKWLIGGALLAVAGFVLAQGAGSGSATLGSFAKALNSADGLNATYSITQLGGSPENYTVNLGKPNLVRIESSSQLIVADGTTITFLDKKANSYFKRAQTPAELKAVLSDDAFALWGAFFNADAYKGVVAKALPDKNRKGTTYKVVTVSAPDSADITWTLYINPQDSIARQAEIVVSAGKDSGTKIIDCKSLELKKADVFAFKAPAGSKEINEAELYSDRWYTDLEEAKKVATQTKRVLMVDFYADW
jgi:outer membrane lipoprotein-sorting protein